MGCNRQRAVCSLFGHPMTPADLDATVAELLPCLNAEHGQFPPCSKRSKVHKFICSNCTRRPSLRAAMAKLWNEAVVASATIPANWALSSSNMEVADRYAIHGWPNAVAGVLTGKVAPAILSLRVPEEKRDD